MSPVVFGSFRAKYLSTELPSRGISLGEMGCNLSLYIAKVPSLKHSHLDVDPHCAGSYALISAQTSA